MQKMADPVILIHGAWQGGWAWGPVVPLLEAAGLEVLALDLPGNGADGRDPATVTFADHLAFIGETLDRLGRPASLVGHSGGGLLASAAGERFVDRVARIAYVAGMMLPSGASFGDLQADVIGREGASFGITPHLIWSADRKVSTVPADRAISIFYHDCPPAAAEAAAARLTPQPEACRNVRVAWTPDRFGRLPRLYVEAADDRSVLPAAQRRMRALVPGADVVVLPCGHAPQLAMPERLANALLPFLTAGGDASPSSAPLKPS